MSPSATTDVENSDPSDDIDSPSENAPEKQTEKETKAHSDAESALVSNDTAKESVEITDSSNEENSEDPELQFIANGSQDELVSSSTTETAEQKLRTNKFDFLKNLNVNCCFWCFV